MPQYQVPSSGLDPRVQQFLKLHNLTGEPTTVDYSDLGYDPAFCHVSAKHSAIGCGGRRIHGWAIWVWNLTAFAVFHSVWEIDGKLVDVTPPGFGSEKVMFVRDPEAEIFEIDGVLVFPTNRTNDPSEPFYHDDQSRPAPATWGLPLQQAAYQDYCQKLGFNPLDIVTDTEHG